MEIGTGGRAAVRLFLAAAAAGMASCWLAAAGAEWLALAAQDGRAGLSREDLQRLFLPPAGPPPWPALAAAGAQHLAIFGGISLAGAALALFFLGGATASILSLLAACGLLLESSGIVLLQLSGRGAAAVLAGFSLNSACLLLHAELLRRALLPTFTLPNSVS